MFSCKTRSDSKIGDFCSLQCIKILRSHSTTTISTTLGLSIKHFCTLLNFGDSAVIMFFCNDKKTLLYFLDYMSKFCLQIMLSLSLH